MSSGQQKTTSEADNDWRLFQARYNYAWACFDFHAKQRMTMFNFFLIFAGFVINAWVQAMDKQLYIPAIVVSLVGAVVAAVFVFLERRNEELVYIAEDVLEKLENDILFDFSFKATVVSPRRRGLLGNPLAKAKSEIRLGILNRQAAEEKAEGQSKYSHGKWMPRIQFIVLIAFLIFAFISLSWQVSKTPATTSTPAATSTTKPTS
jgi:hypothetical protein